MTEPQFVNQASSSEPAEPERPVGSRNRTLAMAVGAVVAIAAVTFLALRVFGGEAETAVTLRALGASADDAFTRPIAPTPSASLADFAQNGRPPDTEAAEATPEADATAERSGTLAQYRTVAGSVPGVFGGSLDEETCDTDQLVSFLESEPAKARAWALVLGMDADDIGAYVATLTAANLGADTRVLEHGFSDGDLVARQAVLQRGTAVLVDPRGVPRVDCYSGNPLRRPTIAADETFAGSPWPAFDRSGIVVIDAAAEPVAEFELFDITDGSRFTRPVGTTGSADLALDRSDQSTDNAAAEPTRPAPSEPPAVTRELTIAGELRFDSTVQGEVGGMQDELIYTFDAPPGAKLVLRASNDRASVGTIAFDFRTGGDRIGFFRVPAGGTETFPLTLGHDDGGGYEVVVSEGPGAFELRVDAGLQDDAGQGRDAGADFDTALEISSGDPLRGHLAGFDQGDAYLLDLSGAPLLVLTATTDRGSDRAAAFDLVHRGDRITFFRVNPADEERFEILFASDDALLELYVTEGPAEYGFVAELLPQRDGGQDGDAPSDLPNARDLGSIESFGGQVGDRDLGDYFLFEGPADRFVIDVGLAATSDRAVGVDILGPDGNRITFARVQPGATESFEIEAASEDKFEGETFRLILTEGRGAYEVTIS